MSANLTFKLNGQIVPSPVQWQDIQIEASFINDTPNGVSQSIQPNISIDKFEFVNEAAKLIRGYISDGEDLSGVGIFEGLPFEIIANDDLNNEIAFDGILDLTDEYEEIHTSKVSCKVKKVSGLNTFDERSEAVTYGLLLTRGIIKSSDIESLSYVVEEKTEPLKLLFTGIILFLFVKELILAVKDLAVYAAIVLGTTTGGVTGPAAGILQALSLALIQLAYIVLLIIAITQLAIELINTLVSPVRFHKVITLKKLLERGAEYLGYELETDIEELDFVRYLASKPDEEEPLEEGIPRSDDFGYTISEAFDLAKRLFNAKVAVLGDKIVLRSLNSPFWKQNSTYIMPPRDLQTKSFNTEDFAGTTLISFLTDPVDSWTLNNFKGTNFEVVTTPINVNDQRNVLTKGFDNVEIPCALGNRKDGLNAVETAIRFVAGAADAFINLFGAGSRLSSKVTARVGMLKVSQNYHTVPKLIYLINGKIPSTHRDKWSARLLYEKYHVQKSFVADDFGNQYETHRGVRVPFGFQNFLQVTQSNLFVTWDQRDGQFDSVKWNMSRDFAESDFRIKKVYTKNLKEETREPE